jgi:hypothetical protein
MGGSDANPVPEAGASLFQVFVDDNFHYMDATERYRQGAFPTCEAAIEVCRRIVDDYLLSAHKPGMTAEELWDSYVTFGEDPFIIVPEGETCPFSAWDYARSQCELLCAPAGS